MLNVLRFIVIVVTALVVFGWSLVAAEENGPRSVLVSSPQTRSVISHTLGVQAVRLEAMPEIPSRTDRRPTRTRKQAVGRSTNRKPKIDLTPKYSRPDFGSMPPLPTKRPAVAESLGNEPLRKRSSSLRNEWLSEEGLVAARTAARNSASSELPMFATSAPAASLFFVESETEHDPSTNLPTENHKATSVAKRPAQSKTVSLQPARLNHKALRERIDAFNFSVAAIEQQITSQNKLDVDSIELIVDQIDEIIADQSLWSMYLNLLSPAKRRTIGSVSTLDSSLNALRERIFEARVEVDVDGKASFISKTKKKQRLKSLDQQVENWLLQ